MSDYEYIDEAPRHKKKSTAKPPKKAKHKHLCEPCIISYPNEWWTKEHLRTDARHEIIGVYCPICGKIGDIKDRECWYKRETVFTGNVQWTKTVLTEEGEREMNPETRTLPTFRVDDPFAKFVNLSNTDKGE